MNRGELVSSHDLKARRPLRRLISGCCAAALLGGVWIGCGTPEERFKVLSFFFDGVPDPALATMTEEEARAAGVQRRRIRGVNYFLHAPYEEGACSECHVSISNVYESALDSGICLKCHDTVTRQYPRMHGPVAAVACLYCHASHDSDWPELLKTKSPSMCTQCHERGVLLSEDPPGHLDLERSCLDCHFGHGGTAYGFLKEFEMPDAETDPPVEPIASETTDSTGGV